MQAATFLDLRLRLEHEHVEQLRQFRAHQEYLIMRDGRRALEVLITLESQLLNHMELEERYLLPLCEQSIDRPGHWGPQVYAQEHKRIKEMLATVRMRIAAHCLSVDSVLMPGDVIDLLDEEKVLKHLISHHQTREATALYPRIFDRVVA
ncbi:MAG TPA: hemerythrin domain-containing protein [Gammaproteobacteria bacterium]|nr:hemerythrin domain-containing protein [Gammaproteobacteria bacterium]